VGSHGDESKVESGSEGRIEELGFGGYEMKIGKEERLDEGVEGKSKEKKKEESLGKESNAD